MIPGWRIKTFDSKMFERIGPDLLPAITLFQILAIIQFFCGKRRSPARVLNLIVLVLVLARDQNACPPLIALSFDKKFMEIHPDPSADGNRVTPSYRATSPLLSSKKLKNFSFYEMIQLILRFCFSVWRYSSLKPLNFKV